MPIPVHTDHFLAQVVMRPDTLPDSNSFVNTWFFLNEEPLGSPSDMANRIQTVLNAFYNQVNAPGTGAITAFLSAVINPTLTEYRVYDLGQPAPRTPLLRAANWTTSGSSALPNEVSVVLSYRSGPGTANAGGTANKRARGRLYIGPLHTTASIFTGGDQDVRVSSGLTNALIGGARNVRDTTQALQWMQYSRVANTFGIVTGGFINNSLDTQRRRGADSTARSVWD